MNSKRHMTSQRDSSQSFSRFFLPLWYWSTVCFRSLFEQNISCCTSLKCLALWSKLSPIICLYLAPLVAPFILVCAEKPADTTLLSQPFFKVATVISCDCFLADTELNIMADKFKYSFNQCLKSFVFCSQSVTGLSAASRLLSWASLYCQTHQISATLIIVLVATSAIIQYLSYQRGPYILDLIKVCCLV